MANLSSFTCIKGTVFSKAAADSVDSLTNVMVLHPIACAIAFLAFALSLGAGVIGSLFGAIVAFVAWVLTTVVMAVDFSLFGVSPFHSISLFFLRHALYIYIYIVDTD